MTYPSGVKVDGGAELKPTEVKEQPQLSWETEPGALYTVVMTGERRREVRPGREVRLRGRPDW